MQKVILMLAAVLAAPASALAQQARPPEDAALSASGASR